MTIYYILQIFETADDIILDLNRINKSEMLLKFFTKLTSFF